MKKLVAAILALIMLFICITPVYAIDFSSIYSYLGDVQVDPGNPRSDNPDYKFSWLDNVIIRYDPNAVTSAPVTPVPSDYLYSETFEGFTSEVDSYSALFELDENTVISLYEEMTTALYYVFTAMNFTDSQEDMRIYLLENGISLPTNESFIDKAQVAVVYAALKYNAVYVLYEKEVSFPVGITLEQANVIVLSALTGTMLPSGVDTLAGFAVLAVKNYVTEFEQLPISENPDTAELFHWAKVITAAGNEYQVPLEAYDDTTNAQREYVDYAYYASILNTLYDVNVDPIYLVLAMQSGEEYALHKFILKNMLDEKKVEYSKDATCQELFVLACENGYFELEQEFYADIFSYELKVPASCEKIWFTPFSLAGQLTGSDVQYVKIFLNGTEMSPNSTVSTPVDVTKSEEYVELRVIYDDGFDNQTETVYTYKLIKDASLDSEKTETFQENPVGAVQQFVDTIIPNENAAANEKVESIFNSIGSAVSDSVGNVDESLLTTYGVDKESVSELLTGYDVSDVIGDSITVTDSAVNERFDSEYLEELIGGVYATDADGNIITTQFLSAVEEQLDEEGIIAKVTETVKESPEIVAVPSSLLAAFSVAGYLMNRKHRDDSVYTEKEEEQE